jgi:type I restriction enzyme M protein
MADALGPREFLDGVHGISDSRQPADLALTVARMLAAARLWPKGRDGIPGFLDQDRELTRADWLAIVDVLAKRWKAGKSRAENPFAVPTERPPAPPGALEQLRRLVLACVPQERGTPSVPTWLLHSVLDLSERRALFTLGIDPELRSFVVDVVAATPKMRAFCAYNSAADIALGLAAAGADVTLDIEQPDHATLCACLALAADLRLHVRRGDPLDLARADLQTPSLLPEIFDVAVVLPPFNARYAPQEADALGTSLPLPPSIESAGVTLALARGQNAAFCLLPPSFLFRVSKADQAFKERAIRDYRLDTIVGLPRGVFGYTSLAAALVIFRPDQISQTRGRKPHKVFMIDARGERDGAGTDGRVPEGLAAAIQKREITAVSVSVPVDAFVANDFNLSVERYVLSPEALRMRELASTTTAIPLDDLVELYRPQAIPGAKGDTSTSDNIAEVGVADIDEAGLVRSPTKLVAVTAEGVLQARRARLEPGDVVLVIKGSVGKVGFIREIPEGSTWLASQSFTILRLRRHALLADPRVLFRFLSSNLGLTTLQSFRVGSAVPGLQMADVRRLPIVIPDRRAQEIIANEVDELFALQDRIRQLRDELAERQSRMWPEGQNKAPRQSPGARPDEGKTRQLRRKTAS